MRALVVYESLWGNTEAVARAIGHRLSATMAVELVVAEAAPPGLDGVDLLLVGGPTHAFSMTRATSRQEAVDRHGAPRAPARGIREWLADLDRPSTPTRAATFDTRTDKPRLPGSAARAAAKRLSRLGFDLIGDPMSFRVSGYDGPLLDGELDRAAAWATGLAAELPPH
ncbi:flavodoxin family protein [Microbacterium sp. Sa4CUA7]|uniref:Flavodoxin family protein n=1 Tax=Microbacterium pullorum TaxID=2762236 RepID=A0ABR8S3V7_9MICO|nr:flavodoxin family protein [Microbacterium pullorum]MBD7958164.1 flavodoxin family protein [Microbacterium pullorum]